MIKKVKIKVINPIQTGVSGSTGNVWRSQDIVVGWMDKRNGGGEAEHLVSVSLKGATLEAFEHCQYQVGDELDADIFLSTRTAPSGRVYTDVMMFI